MTLVGLMTAVICVIAPFSLTIPFSPVPLSLATLAIYFTVTVLGMKRSLISVTIYLLLGLVGIPVFSNFTGGIGTLLGPTGGYLLGYLFLTVVFGFFMDRWPNSLPLRLVGMVLGTTACYLLGTIWLAFQASLTITQAMISAVIPFIPGDFAKISVALFAGHLIRKRLAKANLI